MTNAMDIGVAGMRAAEVRVNVRAQNIVNWQSKDYRPLDANQTSTADGSPVVKVVRPPELQGEFPFVDLVNEIVDMNMAKHAYAASAKVVHTADEMSKTLLDTIA